MGIKFVFHDELFYSQKPVAADLQFITKDRGSS